MLQVYMAAQGRLTKARRVFAGLRKDDSGAALIEYALVVGLMAVFAAGALAALQGHIATALNNIGVKLDTVQ